MKPYDIRYANMSHAVRVPLNQIVINFLLSEQVDLVALLLHLLRRMNSTDLCFLVLEIGQAARCTSLAHYHAVKLLLTRRIGVILNVAVHLLIL